MPFNSEHYYGLFIGSGWGPMWSSQDAQKNYQEFERLEGAPRDVRLLHHTFVKYHDYRAEQLIVLRCDAEHPDQWPTEANIKREMAALAQRVSADPKAVVLFHYSGHGKTLSGSTNLQFPGYNFGQIPSAGTAVEELLSLSDLVLQPLFHEVTAPGGTVIMLDCCHAGAANSHIRGLVGQDQDGQHDSKRPGWAVLSAAGRNQKARERLGCGLMTAYLVEALLCPSKLPWNASTLFTHLVGPVNAEMQNTAACVNDLSQADSIILTGCNLCSDVLAQKPEFPWLKFNRLFRPMKIQEANASHPNDAAGIPGIAKPRQYVRLADTGGANPAVWVIPVDSNGSLAGEYYEGTLGVVVGVYEVSVQEATKDPHKSPIIPPKVPVLALKLPRLMAESPQENYYTVQLLNNEALEIQRLNNNIKGAPALAQRHGFDIDASSLAQANIEGLLIKPRAYGSTNAILKSEVGSCLFVAFPQSGAPKLVLVKPDGTSHKMLAPTHSAELLTKNNWIEALLAHLVKPGDPNWLNILNLDDQGNPLATQFSCPADTSDLERKAGTQYMATRAKARQEEHRWYGALPSIVFPWYPQTFQQTIVQCAKDGAAPLYRDWELKDHLTFMHRMAGGLALLHLQESLHGDLRPANIFLSSAGRASAGDPKNYLVGDYGSYSQQGLKDFIAVGRHRQSPFYSRERSGGNEYEKGNRALILHVPPHPEAMDHVLIRIGWSEMGENGQANKDMVQATRNSYLVFLAVNAIEVLEREGHEDKASALTAVKEALKALNLDPKDTDTAQKARAALADLDVGYAALHSDDYDFLKGDYLQLRQHLWKFEAAWLLKGDMIFLCEKECWEIINDRMTQRVSQQHVFEDEKLISIPRFTHIPQWSPASDIYSLGVLALYSVFFSVAEARTGTEAERQMAASEEKFREFMSIVSHDAYFETFWFYLAHFWKEADRAAEQPAQGRTLDVIFATAHFDFPKAEQEEEGLDGQDKSLPEYAKIIAREIVCATPNALTLLKNLDWNAGEFLTLLTFAMACLHRRQYLNDGLSAPFCDGRLIDFSKRKEIDFGPMANRKEIENVNVPVAALSYMLRWLPSAFADHGFCFTMAEQNDKLRYDGRPQMAIRQHYRILSKAIQSTDWDAMAKSLNEEVFMPPEDHKHLKAWKDLAKDHADMVAELEKPGVTERLCNKLKSLLPKQAPSELKVVSDSADTEIH